MGHIGVGVAMEDDAQLSRSKRCQGRARDERVYERYLPQIAQVVHPKRT